MKVLALSKAMFFSFIRRYHAIIFGDGDATLEEMEKRKTVLDAQCLEDFYAKNITDREYDRLVDKTDHALYQLRRREKVRKDSEILEGGHNG